MPTRFSGSISLHSLTPMISWIFTQVQIERRSGDPDSRKASNSRSSCRRICIDHFTVLSHHGGFGHFLVSASHTPEWYLTLSSLRSSRSFLLDSRCRCGDQSSSHPRRVIEMGHQCVSHDDQADGMSKCYSALMNAGEMWYWVFPFSHSYYSVLFNLQADNLLLYSL